MAISSIISSAIAQGAPAYNMGQIAECASIYAATARRLLDDHRNDLHENVKRSLEDTLEASNSTALGGYQGRGSSADRIAWAFRRSFDAQIAHARSKVPSQPAQPKAVNRTVAAEVAKAIAQGAPAYNKGDIAECVQIYTITAQRLLTRDLTAESRGNLDSALQRCENMPLDINGNAWALRHALDSAAPAALADADVGSRAISGSKSTQRKGTLIRNFSMGYGLDLQGSCVNDTVMGGRSNSSLRMTPEGALFEGTVTKQGGGGFVSVRFYGASLLEALQGRDGLAVSVRCLQGCTAWKLQLNEGMGGTQWQAGFIAPTMDFKTIRTPLSAFMPTWRGKPRGARGISDDALTRIQGVGFMLSFLEDDGSISPAFQEGKFSLLVSWIASY